MNTPLHIALIQKNFQLGDLLVRKKADETLKNSAGLTAWQCLTYSESVV